MVSIVLTGDFDATNAYANIRGVKYTSAQTVSVPAGTLITVAAGVKSTTGSIGGVAISLNNEAVALYDGAGKVVKYVFSVTDNATISFSKTSISLIYYSASITMPA